jgi:hypothetical protein
MKKSLVFMMMLGLISCNGGGGGSSSGASSNGGVQSVEKVFFDAHVSRLKVVTNGVVSYTGLKGEFSCNVGDSVDFYLSNLKLNQVEISCDSSSYFFVNQLVENGTTSTDLVRDISSLLLALDDDNLTQGIQLASNIHDLDYIVPDIENGSVSGDVNDQVDLLLNDINFKLSTGYAAVTRTEAASHLAISIDSASDSFRSITLTDTGDGDLALCATQASIKVFGSGVTVENINADVAFHEFPEKNFSRDYGNNDFNYTAQSWDLEYDNSVCSPGYSYQSVILEFDGSNTSFSGDYSFKTICMNDLDGSVTEEIVLCDGTWAE